MSKRVILSLVISNLILLSAMAQSGNISNLSSRKGWSVGVEGSYGNSNIASKILAAQPYEIDNSSWESSLGNGMSVGVNGYYFFNEYFGIKSGIVFNTYESSYNLNGHYQEKELSLDVNQDEYYKNRTADYDSDISLSYISLPVVANLTLGKLGKNGVFIEGGAVLEQKFVASSITEGSFELYGFYPYHPTVTQTIRIEELGYYSLNINETEDITTSFFNISGYLSFGLNLAFGFKNTVRIGAELISGIRNMDFGDKYEEFFDTEVTQPILLTKYSFKLSYVRKLDIF